MKKIIITIALLLAMPLAHSVDGLGLLEMDGDTADSATPGDDFNNIYLGNSTTVGLSSFAIDDYGNCDPTTFTGGSTKDPIDFPSWFSSCSNLLAKSDLHHGYFAGYTYQGADTANGLHTAGDVVLYYGIDALPIQNGTMVLGFWILQDELFGSTPPTFSGNHAPNDILIIAEIQGNGSIVLNVYVWNTSVVDNLELVFSAVTCDPVLNPNPIACGYTNATKMSVPWTTVPRPQSGISSGEVGEDRFLEVGINISALFRQLNQSMPCFNAVIYESRSSTSVTSVLKDFITEAYVLCPGNASLNLTKTANTVTAETGDSITYTVTIENTALNAATLTSFSDSLVSSGITLPSTCSPLIGQSSCTFNYNYTIPPNSPDPLINTFSANYQNPDLSILALSDDHSIDLDYLSDISVSKSDAQIDYQPGVSRTYTITIDNNGPDDVTGLAFNDVVPDGLAIGAVTCSPAPACSLSVAGQTISGTIDIANGASVTVSVPVTYSADSTQY